MKPMTAGIVVLLTGIVGWVAGELLPGPAPIWFKALVFLGFVGGWFAAIVFMSRDQNARAAADERNAERDRSGSAQMKREAGLRAEISTTKAAQARAESQIAAANNRAATLNAQLTDTRKKLEEADKLIEKAWRRGFALLPQDLSGTDERRATRLAKILQ